MANKIKDSIKAASELLIACRDSQSVQGYCDLSVIVYRLRNPNLLEENGFRIALF